MSFPSPATIHIHLTRVDAEVWRFNEVSVVGDWAEDFNEDALERIREHVKEAIYELGYVFEDDPPVEIEA